MPEKKRTEDNAREAAWQVVFSGGLHLTVEDFRNGAETFNTLFPTDGAQEPWEHEFVSFDETQDPVV